jgi:hypothetical protein
MKPKFEEGPTTQFSNERGLKDKQWWTKYYTKNNKILNNVNPEG